MKNVGEHALDQISKDGPTNESMTPCDAVRKPRDDWISKGKASSPREINCGLCFDFADELENMGNRINPPVTALEIENFVKPILYDEEHFPPFDRALIRKHWKTLPQDEETLDFWDSVYRLCDLGAGAHGFIWDGSRFYDAECPEGVESLFDLPFLQRAKIEKESTVT